MPFPPLSGASQGQKTRGAALAAPLIRNPRYLAVQTTRALACAIPSSSCCWIPFWNRRCLSSRQFSPHPSPAPNLRLSRHSLSQVFLLHPLLLEDSSQPRRLLQQVWPLSAQRQSESPLCPHPLEVHLSQARSPCHR